MIGRYAVALSFAIAVSLVLFWVMQFLIRMEGSLEERVATSVIDFVRVKRESEPEIKKREKPKRMEREQPPPPPDLNMAKAQKPDSGLESTVGALSVDTSIDVAGPNLGEAASDSDTIPLQRIPPVYPARAKERGLEGWVQIEFTISKVGTVANAHVVKSSHKVFEEAALRAIRKWKYKPKTENGEPVERRGMEIVLSFKR